MGRGWYGPPRLSTKLSSVQNGGLIVRRPILIAAPAGLTAAETGVVSFMRGESTIFSTHPVEKPYRERPFLWPSLRGISLISVIFQVGSSDPDLALQAAKVVQHDVSGM